MYHANCQIAPCDDCDRQARRVLAKRMRGYEDIKYAFFPEAVWGEDEPVGHIHFIVDSVCILCGGRLGKGV